VALVGAILAVALAGCRPAVTTPAQPSQYPLTVNFTGTGSGSVVSTSGGLNCTSSCTVSFPAGLRVTLYAAANPGSLVAGFSGDCAGLLVCSVPLDASRSVNIEFVGAPVSFESAWGSSGSAPGQFNQPHSVATDASGNVYVTDTGNNRVQKFDASGHFTTSWGSFGSADGQFNTPLGIAVDGSGQVLVADNGNARVERFDAAGNFLGQWTVRGAYALATDPNGDVYVTDNWQCRVQKFDSTGALITAWGDFCGSQVAEFEYPVGIAVDAVGDVFVTDDYGYRVQKFDATGKYVSFWGGYGQAFGRLNIPRGIVVDHGVVFVVDAENSRVQLFDTNGQVLGGWGGWGSGAGQFIEPVGITVSAQGEVYVVDRDNSRIQRFS
jgi:tripartite motif-containing protein 71